MSSLSVGALVIALVIVLGGQFVGVHPEDASRSEGEVAVELRSGEDGATRVCPSPRTGDDRLDGSVAVVDRLEADLAVLVFESRSRSGGVAILSSYCLPARARQSSAVVRIAASVWAIRIRYEPALTRSRAERISRRFDRLAERRGDPNE